MLTRDALIRLCCARDLLRELIDQPLSIRDVAREASMSPSLEPNANPAGKNVVRLYQPPKPNQ